MRGKFERPAGGAVVLSAVLLILCLIAPAEAGGLVSSVDGATRPPASQCGEAHEGCTRIRGHIPAASERAGVETVGGRPASLGPPLAPFMTGIDAAGQAAADAVSRGFFFLQVSHDETAR